MKMRIPSNQKHILYKFCVIILTINAVNSAILVPPYFNLVVNRKIHATATCGEGVSRPEEFCILTGASVSQNDFASGIRGEVKQVIYYYLKRNEEFQKLMFFILI